MGILYSNLKMFHFPEKLDSLPADKPILPPLHVRLKPTNRCNHHCRYCGYRHPDQQLGHDMKTNVSLPPTKMMEIVQDLVAMGVKAVTFSGGGEPLVYPHLLKAAKFLSDGGVKLGCLSNGSLLHGKFAEFFAHQATWMRVSMDGWDDASYCRYRGVKDGEYTKIIRNLSEFIKQNGTCALGVSLIVDAENWPHIPEIMLRLRDIGVRSVKISACVISDNVAVNEAYHAPHFGAAKELIQTTIAELSCESFEIQNDWQTLSRNYEKKYNWCPVSQILTVIGADQNVYSCQDKTYVDMAVLGRLKILSFKKFWASNKNIFFRINPSRDCHHHCMSNRRNQMLLEYLDIDSNHSVFI